MDLEEVLYNRCSVRHFSNKLIEKSVLDKIIEATIAAPTAKNKQPFRIYIYSKKEDLDIIDSLTACRYDAPYVALFTYNEDEMWVNEEDKSINSGIEDVSIAATFFMLEAFNLGVDTCWVNLFNNKKLEKTLSLPKNEHSVLLMPFGYRLDGVKASRLHGTKRNIEDLVKIV